jgi:hypothetical protein
MVTSAGTIMFGRFRGLWLNLRMKRLNGRYI